MKIKIEFGFNCRSISKQLRDQKIKFDAKAIKRVEEHANCARILWVNALLTDRECQRVDKRILREIERAVL